MDNIKSRWFQRNLQAALRVLPVSVLTGARQTGKTTLTQMIDPARAYFTLDDVGVLDQAERNPDALLATRPVILDEVQRAPQLLTTTDSTGIRAFRDSMKHKTSLMRGVVLHAGKARPLDGDDVVLPWGWMVPKSQ